MSSAADLNHQATELSAFVTTASAVETEALGAKIGKELGQGDVVLIYGDIGAGKSTFVRGALRALGVKEPVTSPTFTVGSLYRANQRRFAHLDLYRFNGFEDEDPSLLDEYFEEGITVFVEWPERVSASAIPQLESPALRVRIEHGGSTSRLITVK